MRQFEMIARTSS